MSLPSVETPDKDLPPFVKSWNSFYLFLVAWLIGLIALFCAFTRWFE